MIIEKHRNCQEKKEKQRIKSNPEWPFFISSLFMESINFLDKTLLFYILTDLI